MLFPGGERGEDTAACQPALSSRARFLLGMEGNGTERPNSWKENGRELAVRWGEGVRRLDTAWTLGAVQTLEALVLPWLPLGPALPRFCC